MKMPHPASPADIRQRFVDLLDEAKWSMAAPPSGDSHDGPNKRLAAAIRISPSRVGDFLDSSYSIPVVARRNHTDEPLRLLPDPRIRKTVAGFTASVLRTLSWLEEKKRLLENDPLTPKRVVEAYWPRDLLSEFDRESVSDGISDARTLTEDEISKRQRIDVEIWVVSYGPFDKNGDGDHEDFFSSLGKALIAGIDPIDSVVSVKKKPLKELLNLPAPHRKHGRAIAMGPFATLYRRFRGYKFASLPAIGIPLVGLLISDGRIPSTSRPHFDFRSIFERHTTIKRIVVTQEIGHLALLSILPFEVRNDANMIRVLPGDDHETIPEAILQEVIPNKSAVFVSDTVLAFQIYARLSKEDVNINVISQWRQGETHYLNREFVYAPGIMFHDDDDFADLIDESQQLLFKSHWRIENEFLEPLFLGLEGWISTLRISDRAIKHWPDHAPVFLFPRHEVVDYLRNVIIPESTRTRLVDQVCDWINQRRAASARKEALEKLFKISPAFTLE
jgi:hypothetical protein